MTPPTAQELAILYDGLSDEELLHRWRSNTLTELAQEVADAEVRKRELQADAPQASVPETVANEPSDLVTIFRSFNAIEAQILRGRLQAEEIPASVADTQTSNQLPMTVGGVRVQVPAEHAARARRILADVQAGELALTEDGAEALRDDGAPEAADKPVLWNPDVAALLSWVLFTSLFGALIHAANWKRLGDHDRAVFSLGWASVALISFLAVGVYAGVRQKPQFALAVLAHLVNVFAWYFMSGRGQSKYVVAVLRGRYERRSWFVPICLAVIVLGFLNGISR
jgi:hypothetical protein